MYAGNQNMLARVWQNMFENAVKFSPVDGFVRVILRKSDDCATVSISNR